MTPDLQPLPKKDQAPTTSATKTQESSPSLWTRASSAISSLASLVLPDRNLETASKAVSVESATKTDQAGIQQSRVQQTNLPQATETKESSSLLSRLFTSARDGLSSFGSWISTRAQKLSEVRSVGDFFSWAGSTVSDFAKSAVSLVTGFFSQSAALLKAASSLLNKNQQHEKAPSYADLLKTISTQESDSRTKRNSDFGTGQHSLYHDLLVKSGEDAKTERATRAATVAATVSATSIDPATVAELKLARLGNRVPSPDSGHIERAIDEAEQKNLQGKLVKS